MLHLNMNSKKINKIFLELKYKEIFSLPEHKFKILDKMSENFSQFDLNQPDRISLFNPEKNLNVHIFINRLTIDWDEPLGIVDFTKLSNSIIKKVNSVIPIKEPQRIGVRLFLGFKTDSTKEIDSYIINKYFSTKVRNTTDIADEIYNPRLQLAGRKGNLRFNLGILGTQHQLIQGDITKPLVGVVNNYLTFDIDVYKDSGISITKLDPFFNSIKEFVSNNVLEYIKMVEE